MNSYKIFKENGYLTPIDVLCSSEVTEIYQEYKKYEQKFAINGAIPGDYRFRIHLLARWADRIIRHENIVKVVKEILQTDDVLVWSSDLNIKNANSKGFFSWHQDSTYMGLTPVEKVVTVWLAITSSKKESGCVCFLPKTHLKKQMEHTQTEEKNNMLSLGQTVTDSEYVKKYLPDLVHAELDPGQASIHSSYLIHASGPNETDKPRIGLAIRYISGDVRKQNGYELKDRVTLVNGVSFSDAFDLEKAPEANFSNDALNEHSLSMEREKENYFQNQSQVGYKTQRVLNAK